MRRLLIQYLLPGLFCLIPLLAGMLVILALRGLALEEYLKHLRTSYMDWLILSLGVPMFVIQLGLTWKGLRWTGTGFDESTDTWINTLTQAAEWFPILGLLGTVAGILETFSQIGGSDQTLSSDQIISSYAPAITATGSGLYMALLNILPGWMVQLGRNLITTLGTNATSPPREVP
ncbi:MAG: MotA/TolQ/ExbB proton channel family protein [Gemmataceae bacterium]